MATTTPARTPPMEPSDESDAKELQLARDQGDALQKTLKHMTQEEAEEGKTKRAGDYKVAYAVEHAEGLYHMEDGELVWRNPEQENIHVEVAVCDGADGRFIPNLTVHVTLTAADGNDVRTHRQPYLWHPWLYHYGRNWTVPGDGKYTMRVRIEAPDFPRHDKTNGLRFREAVEVEFPDVHIKTGQKIS